MLYPSPAPLFLISALFLAGHQASFHGLRLLEYHDDFRCLFSKRRREKPGWGWRESETDGWDWIELELDSYWMEWDMTGTWTEGVLCYVLYWAKRWPVMTERFDCTTVCIVVFCYLRVCLEPC